MAHTDKKGPPMQHREGIRKMGWIGTCLAFTSSFLILTEPTSAAAAQGTDPVRHDGDRHVSVYLSGGELRDGGDPKGWGMAPPPPPPPHPHHPPRHQLRPHRT